MFSCQCVCMCTTYVISFPNYYYLRDKQIKLLHLRKSFLERLLSSFWFQSIDLFDFQFYLLALQVLGRPLAVFLCVVSRPDVNKQLVLVLDLSGDVHGGGERDQHLGSPRTLAHLVNSHLGLLKAE